MFHNFKINSTIIYMWLIHYAIYYIYFSIVLNCISIFYMGRGFELDNIFYVIISPLMGAIGLLDGLFIAIPIVINHLAFNRLNIFKSYLLTSVSCYAAICIYFLIKGFNYSFKSNLYSSEIEIYPLIIILFGVFISALVVKSYINKYPNANR